MTATFVGMPAFPAAARTALADTFHGWRVTLECHSPDVYASAARKQV